MNKLIAKFRLYMAKSTVASVENHIRKSEQLLRMPQADAAEYRPLVDNHHNLIRQLMLAKVKMIQLEKEYARKGYAG